MGFTTWKDVKSRMPVERREGIERAAREELERVGFAALRKAQQMTQAELAGKLGVRQSSVALMEQRGDSQIGTLSKYIRAMGGELRLIAEFPEASFNLEMAVLPEVTPLRLVTSPKARVQRSPSTRKADGARKKA